MDILAIGTRVRVHKNLRRGDWSVTVRGKVVAHLPEIVLSDVTFKVSEARRQAVIRQHCREVHAWCEGVIAAAPCDGTAVPITYNPYRAPSFTRRDSGAAVSHCATVHFTPDSGAVAYGVA